MKKRAALNILLINGDSHFRELLKEFIELTEGMVVIGEVMNDKEAAEAVERLKPNLVLVNLSVPDIEGIRTAIELKGKFPKVGIALLTKYDPKDYSMIAEMIGLDGVIQKDSLVKLLPKLLKDVNSRTRNRKTTMSVNHGRRHERHSRHVTPGS